VHLTPKARAFFSSAISEQTSFLPSHHWLLVQVTRTLNRHNPAFVTDFRIYPETKYADDGELLFEKELRDKTDSARTKTRKFFQVQGRRKF